MALNNMLGTVPNDAPKSGEKPTNTLGWWVIGALSAAVVSMFALITNLPSRSEVKQLREENERQRKDIFWANYRDSIKSERLIQCQLEKLEKQETQTKQIIDVIQNKNQKIIIK